MSSHKKIIYHFLYLWIITTPLWVIHIKAQGVDLQYDPLVIQNTLTDEVNNGTITEKELEILANLQNIHTLSEEEQTAYFSNTFSPNTIYGEKIDGTAVNWQQEKDSIDTSFGKEISILWLAKKYQDWYELQQQQQENLLAGGSVAEDQLNVILQNTPEESHSWGTDEWIDFAKTKGIPGLGLLLMGIYGAWKSKRDEKDPLEGVSDEIQASLQSADVNDPSYSKYYWEVYHDVKTKKNIAETEALSRATLEKPIPMMGYREYWEIVQNPKGTLGYRFSTKSITDYNRYQNDQQELINAYNAERQSLLLSASGFLQGWSLSAQNYWNALRLKKNTQANIDSKLKEIALAVEKNKIPSVLETKTIDDFINTQITARSQIDIDITNPNWITEAVHKKEQLEQEQSVIKEALKNHQRNYNSYLGRYGYAKHKNVQAYLKSYRDKQNRLPAAQKELAEINALLEKTNTASFAGALNTWVHKKATDVFPEWEDVTFSNEHIIEKLKELEKAQSTKEKQSIIDYLKKDADSVQAFLYRTVSRPTSYFPQYGLTYAPWYKSLMDNFRNTYIHEAKKSKALTIEKQKQAVLFFNKQKEQIISNNKFTSFLLSATTSKNPFLGQVNNILSQIKHITEQINLTQTQDSEQPNTDVSTYAFGRNKKAFIDKKENLINGLQAIYNTYASIQKGITEGIDDMWVSAKSAIQHSSLDQEGVIAEYWHQQEEAKTFYIQYGKTKPEAFAEMDTLRLELETKDAAFETLYQSNIHVPSNDRLYHLGHGDYYHVLPALRANKYAGKVVKHGPSDGHIAMVERRNDAKYYDLQTKVHKYSTWFDDPTAKRESIAALAQYEQELAIKRAQEWEDLYKETPPSHIDADLLATHNTSREKAGATTETVTVQVAVKTEPQTTANASKKKSVSKKIKKAYKNKNSKEDYFTATNNILYNWHKTELEKQIDSLETLLEPNSPESLKAYTAILAKIEVAQQSVTELDVVLRRTVQRKQEQASAMKRNEDIAQGWYTKWIRNGQQATDYNKYLLYNQRALDARYIIQDIEDLEAQQRTNLHKAQDSFNDLQSQLGREETVYGRYSDALTVYNTRKDQQIAQREQIISTIKQKHEEALADAERYYYTEQAKESANTNDILSETSIPKNETPSTLAYKDIEIDKDLHHLMASIQVEQEHKSISLSSYAHNTEFRWNDPAWVQSVITKIKDGGTHLFQFATINPLAELNELYLATKKEKGLISFGTQDQRLSAFMNRITNAYQEQISQSPLSDEKWNIVNNKNYWHEQSRNIIRHTDENWLDSIYTLILSNEISYDNIDWFSVKEKEAVLKHIGANINNIDYLNHPDRYEKHLDVASFQFEIIENLRAQTAYRWKESLNQSPKVIVGAFENLAKKYSPTIYEKIIIPFLTHGEMTPTNLATLTEIIRQTNKLNYQASDEYQHTADKLTVIKNTQNDLDDAWKKLAMDMRNKDGFMDTVDEDFKRWHFEERIAKNIDLPSYEDVEDKKGWHRMEDHKNKYHDNGDEYPEIKFVNTDGREVIYDGNTHKIITDPKILGTFNYGPLMNDLYYKDNAGILKDTISHFVQDMFPYYVFNANVR